MMKPSRRAHLPAAHRSLHLAARVVTSPWRSSINSCRHDEYQRVCVCVSLAGVTHDTDRKLDKTRVASGGWFGAPRQLLTAVGDRREK